MTARSDTFPVYLEVGQKRVVAGALDWPVWCRIGRDDGTALAALAEYPARYAHLLRCFNPRNLPRTWQCC